jgi:hypothetical protein
MAVRSVAAEVGERNEPSRLESAHSGRWSLRANAGPGVPEAMNTHCSIVSRPNSSVYTCGYSRRRPALADGLRFVVFDCEMTRLAFAELSSLEYDRTNGCACLQIARAYSHPLARPASLCPRRRGGRDAIAIELRRYPVCLRFVVLVSGGALKGVFRGIHRQIPTSVLLRRMDGVERHCNVLRVNSEEATD